MKTAIITDIQRTGIANKHKRQNMIWVVIVLLIVGLSLIYFFSKDGASVKGYLLLLAAAIGGTIFIFSPSDSATTIHPSGTRTGRGDITSGSQQHTVRRGDGGPNIITPGRNTIISNSGSKKSGSNNAATTPYVEGALYKTSSKYASPLSAGGGRRQTGTFADIGSPHTLVGMSDDARNCDVASSQQLSDITWKEAVYNSGVKSQVRATQDAAANRATSDSSLWNRGGSLAILSQNSEETPKVVNTYLPAIVQDFYSSFMRSAETSPYNSTGYRRRADSSGNSAFASGTAAGNGSEERSPTKYGSDLQMSVAHSQSCAARSDENNSGEVGPHAVVFAPRLASQYKTRLALNSLGLFEFPDEWMESLKLILGTYLHDQLVGFDQTGREIVNALVAKSVPTPADATTGRSAQPAAISFSKADLNKVKAVIQFTDDRQVLDNGTVIGLEEVLFMCKNIGINPALLSKYEDTVSLFKMPQMLNDYAMDGSTSTSWSRDGKGLGLYGTGGVSDSHHFGGTSGQFRGTAGQSRWPSHNPSLGGAGTMGGTVRSFGSTAGSTGGMNQTGAFGSGGSGHWGYGGPGAGMGLAAANCGPVTIMRRLRDLSNNSAADHRLRLSWARGASNLSSNSFYGTGGAHGGGAAGGNYGNNNAVADQELVVLLFLHKCDHYSVWGSGSDSHQRFSALHYCGGGTSMLNDMLSGNFFTRGATTGSAVCSGDSSRSTSFRQQQQLFFASAPRVVLVRHFGDMNQLPVPLKAGVTSLAATTGGKGGGRGSGLGEAGVDRGHQSVLGYPRFTVLRSEPNAEVLCVDEGRNDCFESILVLCLSLYIAAVHSNGEGRGGGHGNAFQTLKPIVELLKDVINTDDVTACLIGSYGMKFR